MSSTLTGKAVVGRRIELTYYRDLELPEPPKHPGIITGLGQGAVNGLVQGSVWIRLDGKRYTLAAASDYQGLTYLDDVVAVPALPMGPFTPTAEDMLGVWEDVPLSTIGEDGEALILLTADRQKALAAAVAYLQEVGIDVEYVNFEAIQSCWAVFEWEPEDAPSPWTVRWGAAEGDDQAIQLYYLPA